MAIPLARFLHDFGAPTGAPNSQQAAPAAPAEPPSGLMADATARRLDEAHERGEEAGRAAARAEYEQELAKIHSRADQELAAERRKWTVEQAEELAAQLGSAVEALEARLAGSVARVLTPFLDAELRAEMVRALAENIRSLLSSGRHPSLHISGPEDLLASLRDKLGGCPAAVEYEPNEQVEVRVVADATLIETDLQAWTERFAEAVR